MAEQSKAKQSTTDQDAAEYYQEEPAHRGASSRLAVLGSPVAHSRSPQLHLAAYRALGLDWEYSRWEIPKAGVTAALEGRGERWRGFSVTAPHKAEALEFVATASADAIRSGAVNTIVFDTLEPGSLARGENTDILGALDAFAERGISELYGSVDVLGGGGTAASLGIAAQRLGASDIRIWARRPEAADALAQQLGTGFSGRNLADWRLDPGVSAVIDTVPSGYAAPAAVIDTGGLAVPSQTAPVLFSAAYSPWPTPLASVWLEAKAPIVTGLDLLLHQAVRQVRLFTGRGVDEHLPQEPAIIAAMRAALDS